MLNELTNPKYRRDTVSAKNLTIVNKTKVKRGIQRVKHLAICNFYEKHLLICYQG